ncbi:uracil-DNA glycosylase [Candidatus Woesebacteria bacterium]|nr:uracil-DNA glycosylase [Candidatus Woesebacteria bacterium]
MEVKIEESWKKVLSDEFNKEYFVGLTQFVKSEYQTATVYPPPKFIFRAFELTPFDKVKVVILGQDPYHGKGQANGLCFAVNKGVRLPPSVQNIYKEIVTDLGHSPAYPDGDLEEWAKQGVLLLNATLTVSEKSPGSHQKRGWEDFTDAVIKKLSDEKDHLVFILWGAYAQKKGVVIDDQKHLVIKSAHPSPFSAYNGFFGSQPFSKCNNYLSLYGEDHIEW